MVKFVEIYSQVEPLKGLLPRLCFVCMQWFVHCDIL